MRRRQSVARTTNDRIIVACVVSLSLLGLLVVRCVWLQGLEAGRYRSLGTAQYQAAATLRATRGTIYDRFGRVLAMSVAAPSVFADPHVVLSSAEAARQLAPVVGEDRRLIEARLERGNRFAWVARQLNLESAERVSSLRSPGVGIIEEPKRLYPQGALASHVLGFVGVDHRGLEGLELAFNSALRGQPGWRSTLRDAKGDALIGPWTVETLPHDGADVVLTIDSIVQAVVEDALDWGMKMYHAKGGSIVVLEPRSGDVLAMATRPGYDPRAPGEAPTEARRNRAVTDLFEPGSVFKVVTAAALLEEKRITPDEMIDCEHGSVPTVGRHVLHDHTPYDVLSFRDVIKLSSNIGTAKAAQRLSPEELYRGITAFGFGRPTGIEVSGEIAGLVPPPRQWSKVSMWNIPIGQGVAVTPIQLASMMAAIANGGTRVFPHVVQRIQTPQGRVIRATPTRTGERIIRSDTAAILQDMLTAVVESGTGRLAKVQGLTVAGKTGTAQKVEPDGHYSHSRYVASFVGFGPVPDSSFVIAVSMDEPRPAYYGGVVSAPIFQRIVERLMSYWGAQRQMAPLLQVQHHSQTGARVL